MRKSATQNNHPSGPYMTKAESAEVLGVSISMVEVFDRRQLLEPHYPEGPKAGKRFLAEDVYALAEIRKQYGNDFTRRLPHIAMKAVVASRRVEKKLDELMNYLGLTSTVIGSEKEDVVTLHLCVEAAVEADHLESDAGIVEWAKKLLAVTEDYFAMVKDICGDEEPWKPYLELAKKLAGQAGPSSRARMYIDHARASVRNAAYFYERAFRGARAANKMFPGERYSARLLQRLMPM